jgi:hypothetical protein
MFKNWILPGFVLLKKPMTGGYNLWGKEWK